MKHSITVLAFVLALAGAASAQSKGGKIPWKTDPHAAMKEAAKIGKPMMLYFTSEGCGPCAALERGAFSNDGVVKAAEDIVPILIDCNWGRNHRDISDRFGIRGYPTVVFTDPDGKEVSRLGARTPQAVTDQIADVVAKHSRYVPWHDSIEKGTKTAKAESKPILILFTDAKRAGDALQAAIEDKDLRELRAKFVLIRHEIEGEEDKCEACTAHEVAAPCAVIVDSDKGETLVRLEGRKTARDVKKALEGVLKTMETKKR